MFGSSKGDAEESATALELGLPDDNATSSSPKHVQSATCNNECGPERIRFRPEYCIFHGANLIIQDSLASAFITLLSLIWPISHKFIKQYCNFYPWSYKVLCFAQEALQCHIAFVCNYWSSAYICRICLAKNLRVARRQQSQAMSCCLKLRAVMSLSYDLQTVVWVVITTTCITSSNESFRIYEARLTRFATSRLPLCLSKVHMRLDTLAVVHRS